MKRHRDELLKTRLDAIFPDDEDAIRREYAASFGENGRVVLGMVQNVHEQDRIVRRTRIWKCLAIVDRERNIGLVLIHHIHAMHIGADAITEFAGQRAVPCADVENPVSPCHMRSYRIVVPLEVLAHYAIATSSQELPPRAKAVEKPHRPRKRRQGRRRLVRLSGCAQRGLSACK